MVKQYIAYTIIVYAFIGIFRSVEVQAFVTLKYISYSFALIGFLKIANYFILKKFRFYLQKYIEIDIKKFIYISHLNLNNFD